MGSGGGGGGPGISIGELYARSKSGTDQRQYEIDTEDALEEFLKDFNDRDVSAINGHLETIKTALDEEIEGAIELSFGGSVSKKTYVNGLSDVDMLLCLNDSSLESKSPKDVLEYLQKILKGKLPTTDIKVGSLAVTVKFSDGHEIQLLPAIKTTTGLRISDAKDNSWSNVIHPDSFAKKLTSLNKTLSGKVVPIIKLAKAMNERLPEKLQMSGYHIESLAIQAFKNYKGRLTLREMLKHFWNNAQSDVPKPIQDATGQSRHVDDYLGPIGSDARRKLGRAITRMVVRMDLADSTLSTSDWKELLDI